MRENGIKLKLKKKIKTDRLESFASKSPFYKFSNQKKIFSAKICRKNPILKNRSVFLALLQAHDCKNPGKRKRDQTRNGVILDIVACCRTFLAVCSG